jgi:hypothetical protein
VCLSGSTTRPPESEALRPAAGGRRVMPQFWVRSAGFQPGVWAIAGILPAFVQWLCATVYSRPSGRRHYAPETRPYLKSVKSAIPLDFHGYG